MVKRLGSRGLWRVNMGCLFLLHTWSHLRYVQGFIFTQLCLRHIIITCVSRLISIWHLSHFIFSTHFRMILPFFENILTNVSLSVRSRCYLRNQTNDKMHVRAVTLYLKQSPWDSVEEKEIGISIMSQQHNYDYQAKVLL
jgi:hypothetical protein